MLSLLQPQKYQNLNKILISAEVVRKNHQVLQDFHPEAAVCPVLKSNAYGHGLTTIAPLFDQLNCPFLTVDSLFEAYELFKIGIKTKILILGYTNPENFKVKSLPFEYVVYDLALGEALNKYQPGCNVHLFVDTGMNREGVQIADLPEFLSHFKHFNQLNLVGIASHFADADNPTDDSFTKNQVTQFKKAVKIIEAAGYNPIWKHISASGGTFKIKDPVFTMIRAGLAHYGINPLEISDPDFTNLTLYPDLNFVSTIVQIKELAIGDRVGYNGTFTATKKMKVGLLPAGYYEGVDRRLSNVGKVKVGSTFCPILGRVSMNMTTIDLSAVPKVKVGDEAIIYSSSSADENSLVNSAKLAKTIPYDLLVHLAESVKREVVK